MKKILFPVLIAGGLVVGCADTRYEDDSVGGVARDTAATIEEGAEETGEAIKEGAEEGAEAVREGAGEVERELED